MGAEKLDWWVLGEMEIRETEAERDVVRMTIVTFFQRFRASTV